ncbi:MAG TPA: response regulator, partial [Terriglobia bacterium]|nr:response regulator [Terriglobia bacterium]
MTIRPLLRVYLVDDESLALKRLTRLLKQTHRVDIVGCTQSPEEAVAFLSQNSVDAVFLDIQMPGMTGFELLQKLPKEPSVVFTTAYDRFALDAFEVNSVDYLLK